MKILALFLLGILSLLWGYFSWQYLYVDSINPLVLTLLLIGMFIFGVLFGKIHLFWNNYQNSDFQDNADEDKINYTPEIEPIDSELHSFSEFENIQDNNFLNISNNLKKQKKQDLKIVEGIGPRIEEILNQSNIYSYSDLEQSSVDTLRSILEDAGSKYTMHNPSTWGKQAHLANQGLFDQLENYQKNLVKGVEK